MDNQNKNTPNFNQSNLQPKTIKTEEVKDSNPLNTPQNTVSLI